jgi:1A family penicillin-binding protein
MQRSPASRAAAALAAALVVLVLAAPAAGPLAAQATQGGGLTLVAPPQSARVYARDGSLIAEIGPEVRSVVPLRSLPAYVPRAFVAVEDRRFFEHAGVDPRGIARAVRKNLEGTREGASTITQQLVGAMYPNLVDRRDISLERKVREARLALELEGRYGKERILEAYLNQISFGHGWFGIDAAARHYFGKPASRLNHEETALLAALPKGPGVYSPKINPTRALERRNLVLDVMAQEGVISAADAAAAKRRPIRLAPNHGYSVRPHWVIERVRQQLEQVYGAGYDRVGLHVWTTIDPVAQAAADSALGAGLRRAEAQPWFRGAKHGSEAARAGASGTPYLQGAVVSLDARTGEILALVGGRDYRDSQFNRALRATRQPGSAFKPLLYALALERGHSPTTLLEDSALSVRLAGAAPYAPRNSDGVFRGSVTLREALTQSINTVAVQLALEIGLDSVAQGAKRFGLTTDVPPYPSSALGAAVVRPVELAGAYTAFANRGLRVEPFLVRRIADARGAVLLDTRARGHRTLSPEIAFLATDLMRSAAEQGTGREARQRLQAQVPMAGKTGTTNDGTDVWYVGFTPEIVTAVWVGFDTPRTLGAGAFGGAVAAPIWGEIMRDIYAKRAAPAAWPLPAGLLRVLLDPGTGEPWTGACPGRAERTELFVRGREPVDACVLLPDGMVVPAGSLRVTPAPADGAAPDTIPLDSLPPVSAGPPPGA